MELKNKIIDYIKLYGMDVNKISADTGVSIGKLTKESKTDIDADELCVLCTYLKVKPEDFYSRRINKKEIKNVVN